MFVFDAFQIPKDQMQYSELVTGTESLLLQSLLNLCSFLSCKDELESPQWVSEALYL